MHSAFRYISIGIIQEDIPCHGRTPGIRAKQRYPWKCPAYPLAAAINTKHCKAVFHGLPIFFLFHRQLMKRVDWKEVRLMPVRGCNRKILTHGITAKTILFIGYKMLQRVCPGFSVWIFHCEYIRYLKQCSAHKPQQRKVDRRVWPKAMLPIGVCMCHPPIGFIRAMVFRRRGPWEMQVPKSSSAQLPASADMRDPAENPDPCCKGNAANT